MDIASFGSLLEYILLKFRVRTGKKVLHAMLLSVPAFKQEVKLTLLSMPTVKINTARTS